MRPLVIYHNCPDGFTAAWVVWRAFGDEAEYRPMNYGQRMPSEVGPPRGSQLPAAYEGRRIIFVDFSLPRVELESLIAAGARVEVYDHHKTAEADLRDLAGAKVVFDMDRSGASIAWDEFTTDKVASWLGVRPRLVAYVEDRDLWRWALPESREINEYLFSLDRTFAEWDRADAAWGHDASVRDGLAPAIEIGRELLRAKRVRVSKVCKNVRWMMFSGGEGQQVGVPVVNTAWDFSEIGEYLLEAFPLRAVCAGCYFDRADKRQWSFRSRGDFDVSVLCKRYGGGGHATAAGFTSWIGWEPEEHEREG